MISIEVLEEGCGEDMVNFKCGELKQNYWNGMKHEVLYCNECGLKLKLLNEFLELIKERFPECSCFKNEVELVKCPRCYLISEIEGKKDTSLEKGEPK